ncbi:MAG: ROK family protein [Mycoplasmatales bacterium]
MSKVCIDIGGTNIRVAVIENNKVLSKEVFTTKPNNPEENMQQIIKVIKSYNFQVTKIYICAPGPLDEANTMIIYAPNLPGWNNYPFVTILEQELQIKVYLINDANAATLGEAIIHKQYQTVIFFTVSTGFGGGLAIKQKIYQGEYNTAFEIKDYIVEKPNNLISGNLNGLEDFCSGTGIYKLAKLNNMNVRSAKDVFEVANTNFTAKLVLDYVAQTIANFMKNISYLFNPGVIVFGGSVMLNNEDFFHKVVNLYYVEDSLLINKTKVVKAESQGNSGLIGLANLEV